MKYFFPCLLLFGLLGKVAAQINTSIVTYLPTEDVETNMPEAEVAAIPADDRIWELLENIKEQLGLHIEINIKLRQLRQLEGGKGKNAYADLNDRQNKSIVIDIKFFRSLFEEQAYIDAILSLIIVHELAHALLGHGPSFSTPLPYHYGADRQEIDADRYAGQILWLMKRKKFRKLKKLDDFLNDFFQKVSYPVGLTNTHPNYERRIIAIKVGWLEAKTKDWRIGERKGKIIKKKDYIGEWKGRGNKGYKEGFGVSYYDTLIDYRHKDWRFAGNWQKSKPHGDNMGFEYNEDIVTIYGDFDRGALNKHATIYYKNGDIYMGQMSKGKRNGVGRLKSVWNDKTGKYCKIFDGEWRNDTKWNGREVDADSGSVIRYKNGEPTK